MREGAEVQGNKHAEIITDPYLWSYNFQLCFKEKNENLTTYFPKYLCY